MNFPVARYAAQLIQLATMICDMKKPSGPGNCLGVAGFTNYATISNRLWGPTAAIASMMWLYPQFILIWPRMLEILKDWDDGAERISDVAGGGGQPERGAEVGNVGLTLMPTT